MHDRHQGGWLKTHRAREAEMVFGHAIGLSWGDQHSAATT